MLRVGIVGAGLIGKKRAAALPGARLVAVADPSWRHEFVAVRDEIAGSTTQLARAGDAERALAIVHRVYDAAGFPWATP